MSAKNDVIFKLFFGNELNKAFLIDFLKAVLNLDTDEYREIKIVDPQSKRKKSSDKLTVLDVKLTTKSGGVINIEIQLKISSEISRRIAFYGAKLLTEQLESGDNYSKIKKVINIIIAGEDISLKHHEYHDMYTLYSRKTQTEFTDVLEIHTLELSKLPDEADGSALRDWLDFIRAESKEELKMLVKRSAVMKAPVNKLLELNLDPDARMLLEAREKQRRDMASFQKDAREEGLLEGKREGLLEGKREKAFTIAKKMLEKEMSVTEITDITGLSRKEIDKMRS